MITDLLDNASKRNRLYKPAVYLGILTLVFLIGLFIYFTGGTTSFVHLMYIPIFFTVFLLGIKAGLAVSVVAGLILGPFMPMVVSEGIMQETRSWVFRIFMFITIEIFVGLLLNYIKSINEKEKDRAYIDVVTGYPNSNKLIEDLNKMVVENKYDTLSLIIFEYKNKEMINQYVNYEVGKESYIKLVKTANDFFNSCNIYTVSTNKFIIIIPNHDYRHAFKVASEFADKTKQPIYVDTLPVSIVVQGGIVSFPMHGKEINEIVIKLEKVLSQANNSQKNITIYDNKIELDRIKYYDTLVSLYYSLQNDVFKLAYQPKIDLENEEVAGAEALLRIKIDAYRDISIEQLISIAEEVGFISEITKWVIRTSVKQLKEWEESGITTKISINLSSLDLNDDSIISYTINCLEAYNIKPSMLEFELTERSIIKDEKKVLRMLKKIKETGITISLDDYGSGHNSLNYLVNKAFPFDYIKIDKLFINNITEEQNKVLINGIIETSHVMGIDVVAEGVETKAQVEALKSIGCDIVQGYYFSRPLSPEDFAEYAKIHAYS